MLGVGPRSFLASVVWALFLQKVRGGGSGYPRRAGFGARLPTLRGGSAGPGGERLVYYLLVRDLLEERGEVTMSRKWFSRALQTITFLLRREAGEGKEAAARPGARSCAPEPGAPPPRLYRSGRPFSLFFALPPPPRPGLWEELRHRVGHPIQNSPAPQKEALGQEPAPRVIPPLPSACGRARGRELQGSCWRGRGSGAGAPLVSPRPEPARGGLSALPGPLLHPSPNGGRGAGKPRAPHYGLHFSVSFVVKDARKRLGGWPEGGRLLMQRGTE